MDKIEIYRYLKKQKIKYEVTEYKDVYDMEALNSIELPYPEWIAGAFLCICGGFVCCSWGVTPGSVSPFGILNDTECRVQFYIDEEFAGNKIGVHPNDNTATVWIQADDLVRLLQKSGNEAEYTKI